MPLPTYLDYPVLDWRPDWAQTTPRLQMDQSKTRLDSGAGPIRDDVRHQPRPRTRRTLTYMLASRDEMIEAREFLRDTTAGRLNPFWSTMGLPSLELAAAMASDATALVVDYVGYARFYAGVGYGREHVALSSGGQTVYRKITAAVDNADGTETLTLSAAPGFALPLTARCEFLLLNRLDRDLCFLKWETFRSGTLTIPLVDLPRETP